MMNNTPSQGIVVVELCGAITIQPAPSAAPPAQKPKPSTTKGSADATR